MPKLLPPTECTAEELTALAEELERAAGRLRAAATLISSNPKCQPLHVFMRQTFDIGIRHIKNFTEEVETSFHQWRIGKPIGPKTVRGVKRDVKKPRKKG